MLYIVAFVIGGCARGRTQALVFAGLYLVAYAGLVLALSASALRTGTTSLAYVLGYLALHAGMAVAATGCGYLCRVLIGAPLARSAEAPGVTSTFD